MSSPRILKQRGHENVTPERVLPELRVLLVLLPMLFATGIALMLIMHAMLMPSIAIVPSVSQGKVLPSMTLHACTVWHLFKLCGA